MQVSQDVMVVLEQAKFAGHNLYLTHLGQLDRKLYTETNKVLEAMGGKWNRSAKAHVFDGIPADVLEPVLLSGTYTRTKQDFGQFDSPPAVVARIMELSEIENFGLSPAVLEPSAGVGNIALAAVKSGGRVTAWELDANRADTLRALSIKAVNHGDFLSATPGAPMVFDLVLMNPPFAKQADIDHVLHASKFLKPGGRLVAVMSASVMFRDNAKTSGFRDFVHDQPMGSFEALPENAFSESGTAVRACVVAFDAA